MTVPLRQFYSHKTDLTTLTPHTLPSWQTHNAETHLTAELHLTNLCDKFWIWFIRNFLTIEALRQATNALRLEYLNFFITQWNVTKIFTIDDIFLLSKVKRAATQVFLFEYCFAKCKIFESILFALILNCTKNVCLLLVAYDFHLMFSLLKKFLFAYFCS